MADPTTTPDPAPIDHAAEAMKRYEAAVAAAEKRVAMLEARLKSPVVQAQAAALDRQVKLEEKLNLQARNRQYAMSVESGAAARHLQTVQHLNREYDLQQMRVRNQAAAADLASGAHMRHAKALAEVNREGEKIRRQQEVQSLVAQHGRLGGAARAAAPGLLMLGGGLGRMLGIGGVMGGIAMARTGLSGTAEGVRLEYQWTRLSRQLAAVAIPAFEKIGDVVGRVAGWFERLSGRQQDQFLKMGLLLVALPPAVAVFRAMFAAGTAAAMALRSVAGSATATAVAAPAAAAGTGLAVGGTALAAGAAGTAAAAGTAGAAGAGVGAGTAAAGGAAAGAAGRGLLGRAGGFARAAALPIAAGAAVGAYGADRGIYDMLRREGRGRLVSGLGALGGGALDLITGGSVVRRMRETGRMKAEDYGGEPEKKRRDVTPFGNTEGELGSAASRIQGKVLEALVARKRERDEAAEKGPMGAMAEKLTAAADKMKEAADRMADAADGGPGAMAKRARDISGR